MRPPAPKPGDPVGDAPRAYDDDWLSVQRFAHGAMLEKLRENAHKAHWRTVSVRWLRNRLADELAELDEAIAHGASPDSVRAECADIANFAMMIAERVRL